jgi:hypothetical protein
MSSNPFSSLPPESGVGKVEVDTDSNELVIRVPFGAMMQQMQGNPAETREQVSCNGNTFCLLLHYVDARRNLTVSHLVDLELANEDKSEELELLMAVQEFMENDTAPVALSVEAANRLLLNELCVAERWIPVSLPCVVHQIIELRTVYS